MTNNISQDFVFGTLATDERRLEQLRASHAGLAHIAGLAPADPPPHAPVQIAVSLGPLVRADQVTCYVTTDGSDPQGARGSATNGIALPLHRQRVEWDTLLWAYREHWVCQLPGQPDGTLVRYRIEAWAAQGGSSTWASEIAGYVGGERPATARPEDTALITHPGAQPLWPLHRTGSYAYHVDEAHVPAWLRDAVIYHVFIDRFATDAGRAWAAPSSLGGFFGGTLRGVTERLDYISALGATCLWLSPLFPSPSHHGYDATDYGAVEPRLGSDADLQELIDGLHARGMRVILDYVVNHVSHQHPAFLAARADQHSAEASWFTFTHWPDQYMSFFGVPDMPQINSDAPAAAQYMIDHAKRWLARGVDGLRLDYANGPSHAFWSAFRAATRATKPDSVTLGEVIETPALQASYAGRMDGCLDFLLLQALRQFFAFGSMSASAFDAFLRRHLSFFPADFVLPSFLDNHDMNRFLWVVGGDTRRLKLAALCQCTLPHPPIIYYGTEAGLSQQRDVRDADGSGHPEESRLPMLWGAAQNHDLLTFYQQLVALRRAHPALWRETRHTVALDDAAGLLAYRCGDGSHAALVALNNGDTAQSLDITDAQLALATEPGVALDAATLRLPPRSGALLWHA